MCGKQRKSIQHWEQLRGQQRFRTEKWWPFNINNNNDKFTKWLNSFSECQHYKGGFHAGKKVTHIKSPERLTSAVRFTGIWLILKWKRWTGRVVLPAWERDMDDILKQSMRGSWGKIWDGITSLSTLGDEDKGGTWSNFLIWMAEHLISSPTNAQQTPLSISWVKKKSVPLILVTTCVFSHNCNVLRVLLFLTTYAYGKEKPERSGPNVRPLSSEYLLFFHDSID